MSLTHKNQNEIITLAADLYFQSSLSHLMSYMFKSKCCSLCIYLKSSLYVFAIFSVHDSCTYVSCLTELYVFCMFAVHPDMSGDQSNGISSIACLYRSTLIHMTQVSLMFYDMIDLLFVLY